MMFLSGDHTLDMDITVANISRLTMYGETSGYVVTVVCSWPVGLSFTSMVGLKIHSLGFTSCGRNFDIPKYKASKYTLLLDAIEYAELINCSVHGNLGTALVVYHTSITLAQNNDFTHNHCDCEGFIPNSCVGGGGITAVDSNLTFIGNATFLGNCAADYGGAIVARDNVLLSFTGISNFINNTAKGFGGAILARNNTSLSFTGASNFTNNSAGGNGGAIFAGVITSLSFTGISNFINNSAVDYGGAILVRDNVSLSFTGASNFTDNFAS